MAAPEWVNLSPIRSLAAEGSAVPLDAAGSGSADALDLVRPGFGGVGGQVLAAAGVLVGACSRFFDPVVLAQLDSALAFELADRARVRAVEATALVQDALRDGQSMESVAGLAQHAGASKAAETKAHKLAGAASGVLSALGGTVEPGAGFDPAVVAQVDGAALVEVIAAAEAAKNALCAVQAQAETLLMAQQRLAQARAGTPRDKLGQGVGTQIGLARGESPHRGRQLCELAAVLVREMPHTLHALTVGALNEYGATIMARETVFLSLEDRARVDELLCSDPQHAAGMGNRELGATARNAAYRLEPEAFVRRLEKAESERHVSLRPAADGMTLLTALLPLRQGVRILATLTKVAESAKAAGDERGKRPCPHGLLRPDPRPDRTELESGHYHLRCSWPHHRRPNAWQWAWSWRAVVAQGLAETTLHPSEIKRASGNGLEGTPFPEGDEGIPAHPRPTLQNPLV